MYFNKVRIKLMSLKAGFHPEHFGRCKKLSSVIIATLSNLCQFLSYWIVSFLELTSKEVYLKITLKRYEKGLQSIETKQFDPCVYVCMTL